MGWSAGWLTDLVGVEEGGLPEEALHVARAPDALVHRHLPNHLQWRRNGMDVGRFDSVVCTDLTKRPDVDFFSFNVLVTIRY